MLKYTRFRQHLARNEQDVRTRDMRNHYGSRGGYVRDKRGMDERVGGMDYARQSSGSVNDRYYPMYNNTESGNFHQPVRQPSRDYGAYEDVNYYPVRRSGYFDYNTYGGDMHGDYDMDYTRGMTRDYGENNYKLTSGEIRKWDKNLKKEGSIYTVEQVKQVAQQNGIKFEEYSPELLTVITNMICSDFKNSVKGDMSVYVKMAKDFLEDDDFDGTPEEKAYLYYTAIVKKEDDD